MKEKGHAHYSVGVCQVEVFGASTYYSVFMDAGGTRALSLAGVGYIVPVVSCAGDVEHRYTSLCILHCSL